MERRKEVFIEVLRMLACMLVVLYHSRYEVYEYVNGGGKISTFDNLCLNVCFVVGRFAVPLFFIICGYFAFPIKGETFSFLKKRLSRIVFPLLVWLSIYTLCFSQLDSVIYNFTHATYAPQLWYLYALIGITLMQPLTSSFVCNASKKELQLYILIWSLTLVFNGNFFGGFLTIETNHNGMLFTNPITALIGFYGYFGYILVGHYLKRFEINRYTPYTLFCFGCIIVLILVAFAHIPIDRCIAYCSLSNLFISSSIFILFKSLFAKIAVSDKVYKIVCKIGELTFGIYLIHWLIFQYIYKIPSTESWNCLVTSILDFVLSMIATYFLSLSRIRKYIIG